MTTNKQTVSIKAIRNEFKQVKGSMFTCIKFIYASFTTEQGRVNFPTELRKVMPSSKKEALAEAAAIMIWGKVGEQKTIRRTNKATGCVTEITCTIQPSCDMILRYYVAKYNGQING